MLTGAPCRGRLRARDAGRRSGFGCSHRRGFGGGRRSEHLGAACCRNRLAGARPGVGPRISTGHRADTRYDAPSGADPDDRAGFRARAGSGDHADSGTHARADGTTDDGVHAAACSPTAGVHGIEVPLSEHRTDDGYWTECRARAMGSTAHVLVGDAPAGVAAWAMAEIERLEQCWSRFRPDSELARLHAGCGQWVDMSAAMLLALTCAADLHHATGGLFDPTILRSLERAGYDRSFEVMQEGADHSDIGAEPTAAPGFDRVEIDHDTARVRVARDVRIDLGGLGKGLAADLVSRGLVDRGARTALVSLGGDMKARGEAPEGAWPIPVEHPLDESRVAFVYQLADAALVSSTRRIRAWARGDRRYHHIIDPRTGDSACSPIVAVVATAADAWWAEGIAKAVMIAGPAEGVGLARRAAVRAWLYLDDGQVIATEP